MTSGFFVVCFTLGLFFGFVDLMLYSIGYLSTGRPPRNSSFMSISITLFFLAAASVFGEVFHQWLSR